MTKHSPGPWKWTPESLDAPADTEETLYPTDLLDANGVEVISASGEGTDSAWCRVGRCDAHLIAAAPEMLELLRAFASWRNGKPLPLSALDEAVALLARIDGTPSTR